MVATTVPEEVLSDEVEWLEIDAETETATAGEILTLYPEREEKNTRLDKFVANHTPGMSRSWLQRLIDDGNVLVDGQVRSRTFKVTPGQIIEVSIPPVEEDELVAEEIPLDVVYEDDDIIAINKPAGMVVHPAPGHRTGTLVNALLHYAPDVSMTGSQRPGIVHRLDRDTSGLIVIGRTDAGRLVLLEQWAERTVVKEYEAIIRGVPSDQEFAIDAPIGRDPTQRKRMAVIQNGKDAQTFVTVQDAAHIASFVDVRIETGRTHQIRVHMAHAGFPIVGDRVYNRYRGATGGDSQVADRQMLHARRLVFRNVAGKMVDLRASLPADMQAAWRELSEVTA
jgi:23S rRNA pseudouridine1911/1915/1917 synthase